MNVLQLQFIVIKCFLGQNLVISSEKDTCCSELVRRGLDQELMVKLGSYNARAWLLSLIYNNGEEVTEHETHTRPVFYSFISSQYKARPLSTEYNLALDAARSFFTTLTILLSECKNLSHTLPLAHSHTQHTLPRHVIDLVRSF